MDYRQFIEHCGYAKGLNPEWRHGQTYFNELYKLNPKLADFIRGTEADPFYQDSRLPSFPDYGSGVTSWPLGASRMSVPAVIFDMDGTLADVRGIRHYVTGGTGTFTSSTPRASTARPTVRSWSGPGSTAGPVSRF
jgi:hypothetical protein